MKELVLDTSVAVAWYLPEDFSAAARRWQQSLLTEQIALFAPSLHFWEFANVLRSYVSRREIDEALATEIYELHLEAPIAAVEPERASVLSAAFEYRATAYDAVYIAICLEHDLALLTAEKSTTPWVVKLAHRAELVR